MILEELLKKIKHIVSDGDWDGVVATALLIRYAKKHGIESVVEYPHPMDLKNKQFENVVAVEITPTKTWISNSIIIDHHEKVEGFGNKWIFDENARSVAELVSKVTGERLSKEFMEAVSNIDQGFWDRDELTKTLFLAFQLDPGRFPRLEITYKLVNGDENWVIEWAKTKSKKASDLISRAEKLISKAKNLIEGEDIVFFEYRVKIEDGPRRLALLKLETRHRIVVSLGTKDNTFVTGTIATFDNQLDLREIFHILRQLGYNAGGRKNVGGFQATRNVTVNEVIRDLKIAFKRWLRREQLVKNQWGVASSLIRPDLPSS
ncbi:MAG: hypothetical protein ACTSX9_01170 [Candidatus Njordarchaeales archaeon]